MITRILLASFIAITVGTTAMSYLATPAAAGWDGRTDFLGTHWTNNQTGQSYTCRTDFLGTHCN